MWIKGYNRTFVNMDLISSISYGYPNGNYKEEVYFFCSGVNHTMCLKHITGEKFVDHLSKLIASGEDKNIKVLVVDEDYEKSIESKFETFEEYNNK